MQSDLPKVLHLLKDKPLIQHVIDSLNEAGVSDTVVVVGYKGDDVIQFIGESVAYVWQRQQLGTGHAVMQAEDYYSGFSGKIIVACGDAPLIKPESFRSLIEESEKDEVKAVVLTMQLEDPSGYGRILKDAKGVFQRIVEEKDADDKIRQIKEVNSGTYIFDSEYLFKGLKEIDSNNAQGEFYLPDALNYIIKDGKKVSTLILKDSIEGSGINSKDELQKLEAYLS